MRRNRLFLAPALRAGALSRPHAEHGDEKEIGVPNLPMYNGRWDVGDLVCADLSVRSRVEEQPWLTSSFHARF